MTKDIQSRAIWECITNKNLHRLQDFLNQSTRQSLEKIDVGHIIEEMNDVILMMMSSLNFIDRKAHYDTRMALKKADCLRGEIQKLLDAHIQLKNKLKAIEFRKNNT